MASEHAAFEVDGRMKDPQQQEKLEEREEELRQEHTRYLDQHPELRQVLNDFMSSVLLHRPDQVFEFAREYFSAFKQDAAKPDSGQKSDKFRAVLGSMNIIGECYNPLEFMPPIADVISQGGQEAFEKVQASAQKALEGYTVAKAKADAASTENATVIEMLDSFITKANFSDDDSVIKLAETGKIDLELDNKWLPPMGRINPIIFAMSPSPVAGHDNLLGFAINDNKACLKKLADFFAQPKSHKESENSAQGLLMWDLLCLGTIAADPDAIKQLSRFSYMVDTKTDTQVPRLQMLGSIMAPLAVLKRRLGDTAIIIGCQEMTKDQKELIQVLPTGLKGFIQAPPEEDNASTESGFIYSDTLAITDVTERLKPDMANVLDELKIEGKIKSTTLRKTCIGMFAFPDDSKVVVVGFHCKSFKNDVNQQADFIMKSVELAKQKFQCPVFCVGDMNVEAKWPKGTKADQMRSMVEEADFGMMPKDVRKLVDQFGSRLTTAGFSTYPAAGSLTTLKMRTRFQGQPAKAGELAAVQKDFIICPPGSKVDWVEVGGRPENDGKATNMHMLQPSRLWPGDHFGVYCLAEAPFE